MTLRQAQNEVRSLGMTLRKENGEFRVNFRNGSEDTAYYTDDIDDAVNTAKDMAFRARIAVLDRAVSGPRSNPHRPSEEHFHGPPFHNGTVGQAVYDAVHGILEMASRKLQERGEAPIDDIVGIADKVQDVVNGLIDGTYDVKFYKRNEEVQHGGVHVDIHSHNPPKFTRQDFQFIADVIRGLELDLYGVISGPSVVRPSTIYRSDPAAVVEVWRSVLRAHIAGEFADALRRTNAGFNRDRFLRAALADGNPPIVVATNPGGELIGRSVHRIFYEHVRRGNRVHEFEVPGTRMEGLPDGSIHIYHPDHPVWGRR